MKKLEKHVVHKETGEDLWAKIDSLTDSIMKLALPRPAESFTAEEYRKRYPGMTFHQARWRLRKMLREGLIERYGNGVRTYYTLVQKDTKG